jgi:hypothetical protein
MEELIMVQVNHEQKEKKCDPTLAADTITV